MTIHQKRACFLTKTYMLGWILSSSRHPLDRSMYEQVRYALADRPLTLSSGFSLIEAVTFKVRAASPTLDLRSTFMRCYRGKCPVTLPRWVECILRLAAADPSSAFTTSTSVFNMHTQGQWYSVERVRSSSRTIRRSC